MGEDVSEISPTLGFTINTLKYKEYTYKILKKKQLKTNGLRKIKKIKLLFKYNFLNK